jgi:beta-ketoacyl-acyl-carrier-protein synthase II
MTLPASSPPRVVITGVGLVTPLGLSATSSWDALLAGASGIRRITLFETGEYRVHIAGEAWGFQAAEHMNIKDARRADRNVQFAFVAAREAMAQAGLALTGADAAPGAHRANSEDVGVIVGSGSGGIWTYTAQQALLDAHGPSRLHPMLIPMITVDSAAVQLSLLVGAHGPNYAVASACATGADAIGLALETIRRGDALAMLAGGTEAAVTPLGIGGFDKMGALSRNNEAPEDASRPFDARRDGFVMGEGAGIVVLESLEFALARGARPIAELLAHGNTADALHITHPDPEGRQAARAMTRALQKARVHPAEVQHINAHGTGTPLGDVFEARAIAHSFGAELAGHIAVSATKASTGHLLGAAGAVEAIFTALALRDQVVPPTRTFKARDEQCALSVSNESRRQPLDIAISNAFGFGGHNSVLVMRHWSGA